MGCCQSAKSVETEGDATRPLLGQTASSEYQSSNERYPTEGNMYQQDTNDLALQRDTKQESPGWDPVVALRKIESRLEARTLDISILDRHAMIPHSHSPNSTRKSVGDETSPTTRRDRIKTLVIPRVKLTGPPSIGDALSKPLPSREEQDWVRDTADEFREILKREINIKTTPKNKLFSLLPFPPLLYAPIQ
ncbi:hypothetical protein LOD99_15419 [Oopsacas minuta]|uniref:Uncharacterized protein n=1 Tax=Oopsacas minuta TaxID=111878 RepID=A0AAV7KC22_9METZ|nr:hypothetical protein LOD99_15419 [Oopsacas minuta]